MEEYIWIIWLALFVIMLIVEACEPALVSIWFALGALVALIISFIPGVSWWIEIIVFIVISAATLFALRPILKRYVKQNTYRSNVDAYVGKRGIVIENIEFLKPGSVKLGDVEWTAIPVNEKDKIPAESVVEVVAVNGNKLLVRKVEE